MKECEAYEIPPMSDMTDKKVYLKKNEHYKKKKTLVLDLDETLIHCVDNYEA
jgi:predicted secreted acid phosphatase